MNLKALLVSRSIDIMVLDAELEKLDEDYVIVKDLDRPTILKKIRDIVEKNDNDIISDLGFSYQLQARDSGQVEYVPLLKQLCLRRGKVKTCAFGKLDNAHKATVLTAVLSTVQEALLSRTSICCRGTYYRDPNLFGIQEVTDESVFDLCCALGCSRAHLNIHATTKGLFVGHIVLKTESGEINGRPCERESVRIPNHTGKITRIIGKVNYILVVEKQSVFDHLVELDFHDEFNCVLVTGCGYPDVSTRVLVYKLWKNLKVPVYGLMDADPHGALIYCTYKFGSANMSFDNLGLATPTMKWIGVNLDDLCALSIPSMLITLTDSDISTLNSLKGKSYVMDDDGLWGHISSMLSFGMKGEIECIHNKGMMALSGYICSAIKEVDERYSMYVDPL